MGDAEILLRLLRCVPHTRLHERPQGSQQRSKPSTKRRRLLPTNRSRESPVCYRLHHLFVRCRRPILVQSYARTEPRRSCSSTIPIPRRRPPTTFRYARSPRNASHATLVDHLVEDLLVVRDDRL